eukprot:s3705_g7.t1
MRFGLNQGDLSTYEGRCQLYRILRSGPKHIWLAPKCKAWCKWNQFNASRSIETAQKVYQAQDDDLVHLLLCAALFRLQVLRGDSYHCHLEQPVGSLMLSQDCLQEVMDHSHGVRCDMCTAGNLQHPTMKLPLQKGTQITTTSGILARYIEQFRCSRDHQHAQVAGSFLQHNGKRGLVSEYTELYTSLFCKRVARTLTASLQVREMSTAQNGLVLGAIEDDSSEPASKRRRLNAKVSQPEGYPPAVLPSVPLPSVPVESVPAESSPKAPVANSHEFHNQLLDCAQELAPRVGTTIIENGALLDLIQQAFPKLTIRVVELCKGADRFRKPPIRLAPMEAPFRMTVGRHRHSLEPFSEPDWINWETQSNRQLCKKSPPARLLVSIFAREQDRSGTKRDPHDGHDPLAEMSTAKRIKVGDADSGDQTPPEMSGTHSTEINEKSSEPPDDQKITVKESVQNSIVQHGPKFLALPSHQRQWISKLHHNLGHPSSRKLQNVLQQQNIDPAIIQGVEDFKCSTCVELQEPRISRPASLPEPREFNDCVGCDLVTWTAKNGKQFSFLHLIDAATNFQIAAPVFRTDAETLFETMQDCWFQWAGPCQQLIVDNMSPICSDQFAAYAQGGNIHLRVIAAFAHWQNGKTERHGDILQHMLEKFDVDQPISNDLEFRQALRLCCQAKNSMARSKGYTPEILVLGKSRKLPGGLCEDQSDPAQYLADSESPEGLAFRRHLELRETDRKAFVQTDNSDRLRRAFLRRQRPHRGHFSSGSFVMFWRPGRGEVKGQWHGPARIIIQESDHIIWLSHSSRVYRVAPEHVRSLSEREAQQFSDTLEEQSMQQPPKEMGKGVFQYEDLSEIAATPNFNYEATTSPDHQFPVGNPSPTIGRNLQSNNPEDAQPDSEPGMPPMSVHGSASEYAPTTPAHDSHPEEPPKPEEVPIPSDDDDGLIVQDAWVCQNDKILRIHNKPRLTAFEPSACSDCPVDILHLSEVRITTGTSETGEVWLEHDTWGHAGPRWNKAIPWTGISVFFLVPNAGEESPEVADIMHVSHDQGLECEIFLTAEDIDQIHAHPDDFPMLAASAAKRQRAEVKIKDLTPSQVAEFQEAKTKEINQWLSTDTVKKVLRSKIPEENILKCRWVLTWNNLDATDAALEGKNRKAKARLVILGYMDPDITEIPRDSPTLQKDSRSLLLQYCAARRWKIQSFDVKTAFLRGSRRDDRLLGVEPPIEMRERLQMKPNETCELLKSAYGLVNAPYLWYAELRDSLLQLNFQINPLDPCLFSLVDENGIVHGLIGMHVDDGLCCGDEQFERVLRKLEERFPFGSKREQKFTFTGIQIEQDDNFNIHLNQTDYILAIDAIPIERQRRKQEQLPITEGERQNLRGLIGSLQYAASNTRPDLSARLSLLQSKINNATIRDLLDANRLLGDAKTHADVTITVASIPCEDIRIVAYSDASFASREKMYSQKGGLFLAAHQDIFNQKSAVSSPLSWYSRKIDRVVASTLAAETYALSSAVDASNWLRLMWEWIKKPSIPWQLPEKVWQEASPGIAVMDCKSLYDVISKNTTPQCQEHRTLIEALVIKDNLQSGIVPFWVHSAAQLSDSLTKAMDNYRLREILRQGKTCLHDIDETLKQRADRKAFKNWLSETVSNSCPAKPDPNEERYKHKEFLGV